MGIFGDIGRSNAGQVGQSVFNDLMKYKQAERQDNLDAINVAHQTQQMDIAQRGLAMQEAEAARKAKADAEREADLNRPMDVTIHPAYLSLPDPQKAEALRFFSSNGYTDANGRGRKVDVLNGVAAIEKTKGLFSGFLGPVVAAKRQAVVDSWTALQDATQSGDQKKIEAAQSNYDRTKMAYQASSDKFHEHLNKLDEIDAQSQTRQGYKVVQSDESPTGWAYVHPTTNEVIEGAPAPRDYNADTLYRSATLEERIRHNKAEEKKAAGGMGGKLDYEGARALIRTLPKLKEEAVSASGNLQRIDEMTALLDKGLGGKLGQAKAWLAPWAEAAGMDVKGMSEAQTYELLAQTLGGSMRMAIVGPGQVSNFEQQMLQRVNAGGRAATPAARELLKYYRDIAARKVADYNDSVDSVADVSPATAKLYKRINVGGVATPAAGGSVTTAEEFLQKKGLR